MNDQETNRKLAMAIGWTPENIRASLREPKAVMVTCPGMDYYERFDYRDWRVAGPIAQRYDCFPEKTNCGEWACYVPESWADVVYADTPQKAIALAVIAAHEAGVLE